MPGRSAPVRPRLHNTLGSGDSAVTSPPRVMVIGTRFPDSLADNLLTVLEDNGHPTRSVASFRGQMAGPGRVRGRLRDELHQFPALAPRVQSHVIDAAEEFRPDLVVNVDVRLSDRVVARLREAARAPVVFWFPDSPGHSRGERFLLADYDALFFKDSFQCELYRRTLAVNAHFLPEACNPRWHRPVGDLFAPASRPTVVVAASMYTTRFLLLRELVRRGIDLQIHGWAWPRWLPAAPELRACHRGPPVYREDKARAFRSASVALNTVNSFEGDGLNCRLFEATACGGVVLTEWRARLPELFEVGTEVHCYRDLDGLVTEIHRLARLPLDEREALAAAGSARAHRDHTYIHRFDAIYEILGRG